MKDAIAKVREVLKQRAEYIRFCTQEKALFPLRLALISARLRDGESMVLDLYSGMSPNVIESMKR
jgi:hypothetical protein